MAPPAEPVDRLVVRRVMRAPRDLVFAARTDPEGSSNVARASERVFFAREIRWPIVDSLIRHPRALSAVVSPPTSRSVSAARDSGVRVGWQDRKMSRSTSSLI